MMKYIVLIFTALIFQLPAFSADVNVADEGEVQELQTAPEPVLSNEDLIRQKQKINTLVNQLQKSVIDNPNDESSWYFLSQILHDEGLHEDALYAAGEALRFYPDNEELSKIILISSLNIMGQPKYRDGASTESLLSAAAGLESNVLEPSRRQKLAARKKRRRALRLKRKKRLRAARLAKARASLARKKKVKRAQSQQSKKAAARQAYLKKKAAKKAAARRQAKAATKRKAKSKSVRKRQKAKAATVVAKTKQVSKAKQPTKRSSGADPFKSFR